MLTNDCEKNVLNMIEVAYKTEQLQQQKKNWKDKQLRGQYLKEIESGVNSNKTW